MKISLPKNEFSDIEVGENQLFKITTAIYDEDNHRVRVTYRDKKGNTHSEFFKIYNMTQDGKLEPNAQGLKMFSILYRGVTGKNDVEEAEPEELEGLYFRADVKQGQEKQNGDGYWLNVWSKRPTDDTFDDEASSDEW